MAPDYERVAGIERLLEALLALDSDAARERMAQVTPEQRRAAFGLWGENQELNARERLTQAMADVARAQALPPGTSRERFLTFAIEDRRRAELQIARHPRRVDVGPAREQLR